MACKVCNSSIEPALILKNKNGVNHIYRCKKCKVSFVDKQPGIAELNEYYNGMYKDLTVAFNEQKMNWATNSMKTYVKNISREIDDVHGKTFLDLGGGLGYYSKAATKYGFNSILVEKDPVSVSFAKNELKIKTIIEQDLEEFFNNSNKKYDVVFFRHVIEHVTEPNKVINGISSVLKNNGILIIETDNNAGVEILFAKNTKQFYLSLYKESFEEVSFFSLLKKSPFALDPPRHLFAFRMKNLSGLLMSHSLNPFLKVHYRLGHPVYWPNMPSPSFKTLIKNIIKFKFKEVFRGGRDFLNLFFRKTLQLFGLSSGLCIYAIKTEK